MEEGADAVAAVEDRPATAGAAHEQTLRAPFVAVDDFLDREFAQSLRSHYDAHFANPQLHSPATHQCWNYWFVPGLYTYLRTSPEKVVPDALVRRFHDALTVWAQDRLGMGFVTWPNLSLYVDGCVQHLHNDSTNGRFGYVYSITLDDRRGRGGETLLMHEGDLFRGNLTAPAAGRGLRELVEPKFNRLTVFDDRILHGVERVEGSMDPIDGRIVFHGHISEAAPSVRGPLSPDAVKGVVDRLMEVAARVAGGAEVHGPVSVRMHVGADGAVRSLNLLVDRLVRLDGGDARPIVDTALAALRAVRFPAAEAGSDVVVALPFGGPLPWMQRPPEGTIVSRAAAPAKAAAPVAEAKPATSPFVVTPLAQPKPAQRGQAAATGARAAIGAKVRARLAAAEGVKRIPKDRLEAYVVPDFLDAEACAGLMRLIDVNRVPSGLLSPSHDPEFRTSESCNLNPAHPLVAALETGINQLLGIAAEHGETVQGQRYAVGQQFKPHHDFFHTDQPYWPAMEKSGGQRTWTVMAFLNKPDAGGQTAFPKAGLRITPAAGYLLIWNNLDISGEPNDFSLHQGVPVEAGVKYVITKWYRERPWRA
jgi:prolyl 4-hydroxylase